MSALRPLKTFRLPMSAGVPCPHNGKATNCARKGFSSSVGEAEGRGRGKLSRVCPEGVAVAD